MQASTNDVKVKAGMSVNRVISPMGDRVESTGDSVTRGWEDARGQADVRASDPDFIVQQDKTSIRERYRRLDA